MDVDFELGCRESRTQRYGSERSPHADIHASASDIV